MRNWSIVGISLIAVSLIAFYNMRVKDESPRSEKDSRREQSVDHRNTNAFPEDKARNEKRTRAGNAGEPKLFLNGESAETELRSILVMTPSANRAKLLGDLSHKMALSDLLTRDSIFRLEDLTDEEVQTIASRISSRLQQANDATSIKAALGPDQSIFGRYLGEGIAASLLKEGPLKEAFETVIGSQADSDLKQKIASRLAFEAGFKSPEEFLQLASGSGHEALLRDGSQQFIQGWASKDPHAATVWANSFDGALSQKEKIKLARTSFNSWCVSDPFVAAQWLTTTPPSEKRDAMTVALINNLLIKKDKDSATRWIELIQDANTREKITRIVSGAG